MFLKISLSNTRKFLTRTIQSVKSFFHEATYQRLPKTPPVMPFSCIGRHGLDKTLSQSYRELDKFYTDFTNLYDSKKTGNENTSSTCIKGFGHASLARSEDCDQMEECTRDDQKKKRIGEETLPNTCKSVVTREERRCLVARKLKELEGMDLSNVENAMDIEEVLHYYSHLTSPVYLEIFDQFFVNIYADLFKHFSRQRLSFQTGHLKS
ncbi:hypothetical protein POM88_048008 [Heracleum sosnowskyi]|uniref:OVATE domain-containing protein n=1 Tax=Heracleum sosnowskyi TaxID=360622 RepID=A0AAD8M061_9APIA|nr:hypothetical protein POM88_048008 [Heracleum sosnowskyi]